MFLSLRQQQSKTLRILKGLLIEILAIALSMVAAVAVAGILFGGLAVELAPVFFFLSLAVFYWLFRARLYELAGRMYEEEGEQIEQVPQT
jgi:hypothetical protein